MVPLRLAVPEILRPAPKKKSISRAAAPGFSDPWHALAVPLDPYNARRLWGTLLKMVGVV